MKQQHQATRCHLLSRTASRNDAAEAMAPAITKGCATFWVAENKGRDQPLRRFAVPVALLGHPRILELLGEAREEYGYSHQGAVVVPCGAERFQRAVDAARADNRQHHHHHHFGLPHLAGCFKPSHVVA
ncbi:auxin-responsive protein SAUR32 [Brachypodium distachyon]|uniref:Auxin-responsive protein SAUR32 n=1 Tax=Brachypodium distachyon TaxID=15368 RepID=A0A0Q3M7G7_BRADI|nr:auxin-responsive protein SAUR32 [Brachypodium distachyon]KQK00382.1 hypothetical protein BRADI_3g49010v3 [Brachypodium distachyon]|eukprot:XP_010236830.1 auxin-responsive protein SAUR32 [Brachypodium distachyon]